MNVWQMLRDVLIASMNKGQLLLTLAGILMGIALLRMPSADVSKFVFEVKSDLVEMKLLGYVLFVLALAGWIFHAKTQRRIIYPEMDRIAGERSRLQERGLGHTLESSE